jgi:V/A-type H+-transporting ATPase subunit C
MAREAAALYGELVVKVDPLAIDARLDQAMYRQIEKNLKHGAPAEIRSYFTTQVDLINLLIRLRVRSMGRGGEFARRLMLAGGTVDTEKLAAADDVAAVRALYAGKDYFLRLRRALESYEQSGDLTQTEKLEDDYLKELMERHRYEPVSMLPLVGYMIAREREAAAVRMIMTALINRFPVDKLRERLRDMYGN